MSRRHEEEEDIVLPETQGIALGLISGALLGAAATLLFTTKTGEALCDTCGDMKDSLTEQFHYNGKQRSQCNLNQVIGVIAGSVIGISAIAFLSSKAGKGVRKQVMNTFETLSEQGHDFANHFSDTAHEAHENAQDHISCWVEKAKEFLGKNHKQQKHESIPEKAIYWTLLGIRLYQSLKKER